ncbi:hypothetical protein [Belliella pelovolcani]|uniref:hypothetical protein n=1 Tax=Belliella pelovolcani TaxID=529505 RepID=UPI00391ABA7C
MLKDQDPVAYENKLKELTLFMGEVFKDADARRELFDLAKADAYEEDISYSLKTLLETNQNPNTRQRSAIVNAFYKNAENHRVAQEEDFNEQDLIDFINENNISMLAPYMIGYFEPESITELTVSWWTEEMELEGLAKDPDWKGETPGFKLNINDDGNFIQFRKLNVNYFSNEMIYADDEYAMDNPTVVFGDFQDDASLDPGGEWYGGGSTTPPPTAQSVKIQCSDLVEGSRYTLSMPDWRLIQSVRSWPNNNFVHLWLVFGEISGFNPANEPTLGNNITKPLSGYKILRRHANDGRWQPGPLLTSQLPDESVNLYMVWAVERPSTTFTLKGQVTVNDKGVSIPVPEFTIAPREMRLLGNPNSDSYMNFNKCFILDDNYNIIGDAFDNNGNLITRTVEGDTYPVIRQNVAEFILRTRH